MATVDFRNAYELLRRVMEQQELERQGSGYGSIPGTGSASNSGSYGSPQGGLLGRLIALQEEQSRYQPYPGDVGQAPLEPQNPNFRKLSRVDVRPQGAVAPSDPANDQSNSSYSPGVDLAFDPSSKPAQGAGMFGIPGYMPAPPWGVPVAGGVPLPFPGMRGRPFPLPPMGPGSIPTIPMPHIPDWLKAIGQGVQVFPRMFLGGGGDDEDCKEEVKKAREECTEAFASGWKGEYGLGPYRAPGAKSWTIQDCMRGRISERCGGNPWDRKPGER